MEQPEQEVKIFVDQNGNEVTEKENELWTYRSIVNPHTQILTEEQMLSKKTNHLFRTIYNDVGMPIEQTESDKEGHILDSTKFSYDDEGNFKDVRRFNHAGELIGFDDLKEEAATFEKHPLWLSVQAAIKNNILRTHGPIEGIDALAYAKARQIFEGDFFTSTNIEQ